MKQIDTLDQWYKFADMLSAAGYHTSPSQCDANGQGEFLVRFSASGRPGLEVSTLDTEVYNAMLKYKPEGFERG